MIYYTFMAAAPTQPTVTGDLPSYRTLAIAGAAGAVLQFAFLWLSAWADPRGDLEWFLVFFVTWPVFNAVMPILLGAAARHQTATPRSSQFVTAALFAYPAGGTLLALLEFLIARPGSGYYLAFGIAFRLAIVAYFAFLNLTSRHVQVPQDTKPRDVYTQAADALRLRAAASERVTTFSLAVMVTIVFLGGGAVVGLGITSPLILSRDMTTNVTAMKNEADQLQKAREAGKFEGNLATIPQDIQRIDKSVATISDSIQTYERKGVWSEIAVRATVGLLTFLLVQVFFAVYRYNRRVSDTLLERAEMIQLLVGDEEGNKTLRPHRDFVIRQASLDFGQAPASPSDKALELLAKYLEPKKD